MGLKRGGGFNSYLLGLARGGLSELQAGLDAAFRCRGETGHEGRPSTPDPPLQTMYSVSFHYPLHWVRCHSFLARALASVLSSLWLR